MGGALKLTVCAHQELLCSLRKSECMCTFRHMGVTRVQYTPSVVVHAWSLSTWEPAAGRWEGSQPGLHSKSLKSKEKEKRRGKEERKKRKT